MNDKEIMDQIKEHEGYREEVYVDSVGIPTAGYGHAFLKGSRIPAIVADILFEEDFKAAKIDFEMLVNRCDLGHLSEVRRGVLIDMLFNMGMTRVLKFKKMLAAISNREWGKAANEMLDSKWAGQVGKRSTYLAEKMRKGGK
jgi:lysozyme